MTMSLPPSSRSRSRPAVSQQCSSSSSSLRPAWPRDRASPQSCTACCRRAQQQQPVSGASHLDRIRRACRRRCRLVVPRSSRASLSASDNLPSHGHSLTARCQYIFTWLSRLVLGCMSYTLSDFDLFFRTARQLCCFNPALCLHIDPLSSPSDLLHLCHTIRLLPVRARLQK